MRKNSFEVKYINVYLTLQNHYRSANLFETITDISKNNPIGKITRYVIFSNIPK